VMARDALAAGVGQTLQVANAASHLFEADDLVRFAVAWLDIPLTKVLERVPPDGRRPLAADRATMEQLYARRRLAYAEAHVRIADAIADGAAAVAEREMRGHIGFVAGMVLAGPLQTTTDEVGL